MKSGFSYILGAALMVSASPAAAVPADFAARANAIVEDSFPADGPGAAVIVTEGGKTVFERGRGLADIEAGKPIAPDTVFRIGSITKQFSAAVVLQLAAEGKLSLDDPVSKYFPGYPQPGASATVRQLLNHTSGIQSYTDIPGWMVEANFSRPHSNDEMMAVFRDLPSPSAPGEKWAYNNSGYFLLGIIVEKVTGKPWHQLVHERVVRPLGLSSFRYGVEEASVPAMARPYAAAGDGQVAPAPKIHMSVPGAAGALIGTVGDLARWNHALHHGRILDAPSYKAMTSGTQLGDGTQSPYGYGLQVSELRGHRTIGHGGGIPGFVTSSLYLPEKDVFVAVFTNSAPPVGRPDEMVTKLALLAAGDPLPDFHRQPVDLKAVEPMLGTYKIEGEGGERLFFAREGRLFTRRTDSAEMEVFAAGANRFFYPGGVTWFDIKRGESGPVMAMHQNASRTPQTATWVGPVPAQATRPSVAVPRSTLERYAGNYRVGGDVALISLGEEGLSIKLGSQPTFKLVPRSSTEFEVERVGARIVFDSGADGPATGMTIHQGGATIAAPRAAD
jgi:D-alanyl-D-alanine carboxypeptidase